MGYAKRKMIDRLERSARRHGDEMTDLEEVPNDPTPMMYERLRDIHRPELVPAELPDDGSPTPPRMYHDTNLKKVMESPVDPDSDTRRGLHD